MAVSGRSAAKYRLGTGLIRFAERAFWRRQPMGRALQAKDKNGSLEVAPRVS